MIFQKAKPVLDNELDPGGVSGQNIGDEVETVVGPSVNVEGDFASEGNIIIKGTVSGSVHTSKHLTVERGAKIVANVRAASASIAGEVKGNMKIKDSLELTSSAKILGDIDVKNLRVESGAIVYGRITMPGLEGIEKPGRSSKTGLKKNEEVILSETI